MKQVIDVSNRVEVLLPLLNMFWPLLKETRKAKAAVNGAEGQRKGVAKMLWRAFQLAFRVYTFAGGQDDRADKLTRELAVEIENDPHHQ